MKTWNHLRTLRTFLNEPSEVHAFGLGALSNIFCLKDLPDKNRAEIENEYPYFMAGKAFGLLLLVIILWMVLK